MTGVVGFHSNGSVIFLAAWDASAKNRAIAIKPVRIPILLSCENPRLSSLFCYGQNEMDTPVCQNESCQVYLLLGRPRGLSGEFKFQQNAQNQGRREFALANDVVNVCWGGG